MENAKLIKALKEDAEWAHGNEADRMSAMLVVGKENERNDEW